MPFNSKKVINEHIPVWHRVEVKLLPCWNRFLIITMLQYLRFIWKYAEISSVLGTWMKLSLCLWLVNARIDQFIPEVITSYFTALTNTLFLVTSFFKDYKNTNPRTCIHLPFNWLIIFSLFSIITVEWIYWSTGHDSLGLNSTRNIVAHDSVLYLPFALSLPTHYGLFSKALNLPPDWGGETPLRTAVGWNLLLYIVQTISRILVIMLENLFHNHAYRVSVHWVIVAILEGTISQPDDSWMFWPGSGFSHSYGIWRISLVLQRLSLDSF